MTSIFPSGQKSCFKTSVPKMCRNKKQQHQDPLTYIMNYQRLIAYEAKLNHTIILEIWPDYRIFSLSLVGDFCSVLTRTSARAHMHSCTELLGALWDGGWQMGEDMTGIHRDSCGRLPSSPPHTCSTSCPLQHTQHLGWTPSTQPKINKHKLTHAQEQRIFFHKSIKSFLMHNCLIWMLH